MTESPAQKQWQFDIIVSDGFVLTELAAVVDPIRIANRVTTRPLFQWTYRSEKGGMIASQSESFVQTEPFAVKPEADYLFVIGNSNPDAEGLSLGNLVSQYTHRDTKVFLLAEAASRYIRDRGDKATHLATHWENQDILREQIGLFEADSSLATVDGQVVTCAGMCATFDLVLTVMKEHLTSANLMTIANILLHERIRDFSSRQPNGSARHLGAGDRDLDMCLEIMQANIEDPLPISELVRVLGISSRSLERKFRAHLGTTPNTYYRELRLTRANNLLLNTNMSVGDIGLACGFVSGFSSLYKSFFGMTPAAMRNQRRLGK